MRADDMLLQNSIMKNVGSKVAIVTDSIGDLPKDFEIQNQVAIIPMDLELDGDFYLDRIGIDINGFYDRNKRLTNHPKTSLPNIKNAENSFQFLLEYYKAIIVLVVSDKLSGAYQMIKNVASDFILKGYDIRIINTLKNSGAQGLLVKQASQLANDGIDINNIVKSIEENIPLTKIYVAVDNPSYLARSGRVSQRL